MSIWSIWIILVVVRWIYDKNLLRKEKIVFTFLFYHTWFAADICFSNNATEFLISFCCSQLVLLGDSGVGKSCIVLRFVRGQFDPTSKVRCIFLIHQLVTWPIWLSFWATFCPTILNLIDVSIFLLSLRVKRFYYDEIYLIGWPFIISGNRWSFILVTDNSFARFNYC